MFFALEHPLESGFYLLLGLKAYGACRREFCDFDRRRLESLQTSKPQHLKETTSPRMSLFTFISKNLPKIVNLQEKGASSKKLVHAIVIHFKTFLQF